MAAGVCTGPALPVGAHGEGVAGAWLFGSNVCTIRSWPEEEGSLRRSATPEAAGLPEPNGLATGVVDVVLGNAAACDGGVLPAASALGASSLRAASGILI